MGNNLESDQKRNQGGQSAAVATKSARIPLEFLKNNFTKRAQKIAIVTLALVLCVLGFWVYFDQTFTYGTKTLENGGWTYSFSFTKAAKEVKMSGANYLYGYSTNGFKSIALVMKPTNDLYLLNCKSLGPDWATAFYQNSLNVSYPVCTNKGLEYTLIFPAGNQNQLVDLISQNGKSSIDASTVKLIFGSLVVKK
jgi:hypothetical protein